MAGRIVMHGIARFEDIAPQLTQPLVLVGLVLSIVFGIQRALVKTSRIPPLTRPAGANVVQSLVRYGFIIALLVIVMGFSLALYRTDGEHNPTQSTSTLKQQATVNAGGTAINSGRDFTMGTQQSPTYVKRAASASPGDDPATAAVSQEAKALDGGMAINAGRDVDIHQ